MSVHRPLCQCLPFKPSEMRDTHIHFIRPVAPTPRSKSIELQNLRRTSAVGLSPKKKHERTDIVA